MRFLFLFLAIVSFFIEEASGAERHLLHPKEAPEVSLTIRSVRALEILDSRGNPTLRVQVCLDDGTIGQASIPSGASTGENEAVELRDGDKARYSGKGVLKAVDNVNNILAPALLGHDPRQQTLIDTLMIELDGTSDKSKLGANAILGVSQAVARAAAQACKLPLYVYLADLGGGKATIRLPMPMMNVLNGGKHADNNIDFQEFMIVPVGAPTFQEALRYVSETFHCLKDLLAKKGYNTNVGDEGGFAPQLRSNEEACEIILEAISLAHYRPGLDIAIALDPASTSFYENGMYHLSKSKAGYKTSDEMTSLYQGWVKKYPIISLEDGLAENDWEGFQKQTALLGKDIQIVGDDILVTNPKFIRRAIEEKTCNAALIKLNQIGTVTETLEAIRLCKMAGWNFVISHRSGETDDTFIADLAVAMGGGQIKAGSVCRGERIAKYNRLLEIEAELGTKAIFINPFAK